MYIAATVCVIFSFCVAVFMLFYATMHTKTRNNGQTGWLIGMSLVSHIVTYCIFVQWLEWYLLVIISSTFGSMTLHWILNEAYRSSIKKPSSALCKSLAIQVYCTTDPS